MIYFVYILRSLKDHRHYVGMSKNIQHRLSEHRAGRVPSTKPRLPIELIYSEECADRVAARLREKYWKSGAGRLKIKKLFGRPASDQV